MDFSSLTPDIIAAAIAGYESRKKQIEQQIAILRATHGGVYNSADVSTKRTHRTLSREGRARIAAAQKLRWAKMRGARAPTEEVEPKPARKLSSAGRRAIAEAARRRWAAARSAKAPADSG